MQKHETDPVFHGDATARDEAFPALSGPSSRSTSGTYASAARGVGSRSGSPLKKDVTEAIVSSASEAEPPVQLVEESEQVNVERDGGVEQEGDQGPLAASQQASLPAGDAAFSGDTAPDCGAESAHGDALEAEPKTDADDEADASFDNAGAIDIDHPLPSFAFSASERASPIAIGDFDPDSSTIENAMVGGRAEIPVIVYDNFRWGEDIEPPCPPGMEEFPKLPARQANPDTLNASVGSVDAKADERNAKDGADAGSLKPDKAQAERSEAASAAAAAAEARLASLNRGERLSDAPAIAPDAVPKAPVSRWHTDEKPSFTVPDLSPRVSRAELSPVGGIFASAHSHTGAMSQSSASAASVSSPLSESGGRSDAQQPSWASDVDSEFAEEMPGEIIGLEPELSASNATPLGGRSGVSKWAGVSANSSSASMSSGGGRGGHGHRYGSWSSLRQQCRLAR